MSIRVAARFFSGVPHPHLLGDRCPDHSLPETPVPEHILLRLRPQATHPAWVMMSHLNEFAGGFALGTSAALCLLFAGYLLRLEIREICKKLRTPETGPYRGLIAEVTALKRPLAAAVSLESCTDTGTSSTIVSRRDTGAEALTDPTKTVVLNYQWN